MAFDREFTAYVHQKLNEVSDFFSSQLESTVLVEDLKKQLKKMKRNDDASYELVKDKKVCLSITIKDAEFTIKATGFGDNEYQSLDAAVLALTKQLNTMLDEQVSEKTRLKNISDANYNSQFKH